MKARLPLLALTLALAACAPAAKAPPVANAPAPRPAATSAASQRPAPLPVPVDMHWMDAPLTPGAWRYDAREGQTVAEFRSPAGQFLAGLSCSDRRDVFLTIYEANAGPVTIRTETAARSQIANLSGMFARTLLAPGDPLLDAMALSKGRFAVEATGRTPLYLPSWA